MKLTEMDKIELFELVKEYFGWFSADFRDDRKSYFWDEYKARRLDELGFEYSSGAAKYCIFLPEWYDVVIKFCYDKEFDYCEREYENYCAAVCEGVAQYFPYTDYLGTNNGIRFYVQQVAYVDECDVYDSLYDKLNESGSFEDLPYEDEYERSEYISDWIDDMEAEERVELLFGDERLIEFIDHYHINDLHDGNFGKIDDAFVIIDFSGYGKYAMGREF